MRSNNYRRIGHLAYYQDDDEKNRIKSLYLKKITKEAENEIKNSAEMIKICKENISDVEKEIQSIGAGSFASLMHNSLKILIFLIIAIITIPGEFMFTVYTLRYLNLGTIGTYALSAALMGLAFESFDQYLTGYRISNPQHDNAIFAFFGLFSVISVIALFYFLVQVRNEMLSISTLTSLTNDPEKTLELTEQFYKNDRTSTWVMVFLTTTFLIVTSVSYHITKALIIGNFVISTLYLRRYLAEKKLLGIQKLLNRAETAVETFQLEFIEGLASEEVKSRTRQTKGVRSRPINLDLPKNFFMILLNPIVIFLILIAILVFLSPITAKSAEYIIAIDISKSVTVQDHEGDQEFSKNIASITDFIRTLGPGDSIKVIAISDSSFTNPQIYINEIISSKNGLFGEIPAKDKVRIQKKWNSLNITPIAPSTDIFGALNLASILFTKRQDKKRLIIYGDMRQSDKIVNLETYRKIDTKKVMKTVNKSHLISDLQGVEVHCLGVHSAKKSLQYWQSLKGFWRTYFEQSKALLKTYTIERRIYE